MGRKAIGEDIQHARGPVAFGGRAPRSNRGVAVLAKTTIADVILARFYFFARGAVSLDRQAPACLANGAKSVTLASSWSGSNGFCRNSIAAISFEARKEQFGTSSIG